MYVISCPLSVPVSKKKDFILNLNHYRNAHHMTLNNAKVAFDKIVGPLLKGLPRMQQVQLTYTLYTPSNRLCDTSNICCIVDKFFSDTLVNRGVIEDDNRKIVISVDYRFGEVDKTNPRVDVTVNPVGATSGLTEVNTDTQPRKEERMQIILVQTEIEAAIRGHISSQGLDISGMNVDIDLRATRGEAGFQATVDIVPVSGGAAPVAATSNVSAQSTASAPTPEPEVQASEAPANEPAASTGKKGSLFSGAKEVENA